MNSIIRNAARLLAATALTGATIAGAGSATAQPPVAEQFTNASGEVRCEVVQGQNGQRVLCVTDGQEARERHTECNPPGQLIPSVQVNVDSTAFTGCYNQGLNGQPQALSPGEVQVVNGTAVMATQDGGLRIFREVEDTPLAYAGPTHVWALGEG